MKDQVKKQKGQLKMPLETYVLYHSEYPEEEKAFDVIYQLLCRDVERPLTDGIDIPVYLQIDYDAITDQIKNYSFDNGLSPEENKELCYTTNIMKIVSLALKGLGEYFNKRDMNKIRT